jgi:hypothetical protein
MVQDHTAAQTREEERKRLEEEEKKWLEEEEERNRKEEGARLDQVLKFIEGVSYPLDFYHWAHHDKGCCSVIAGLPHVHPPWSCYLRRNLPTST